MSPSPDRLAVLPRMQEARRRILRQLDLIDRSADHAADDGTDPGADPETRQLSAGQGAGPECFPQAVSLASCGNHGATSAEIDALFRELALQDAAIEAHCVRNGLLSDRLDACGPCNRAGLLCDHAAEGIAIPWMTTRAPFERLLRIARSSTGQSCRVANFILAWWGRRQPRRVRLVRHLHCGSQHARNMATVVHRLFRISSRGISGAYRAEREDLIRVWRLEVSTRTVGIA